MVAPSAKPQTFFNRHKLSLLWKLFSEIFYENNFILSFRGLSFFRLSRITLTISPTFIFVFIFWVWKLGGGSSRHDLCDKCCCRGCGQAIKIKAPTLTSRLVLGHYRLSEMYKGVGWQQWWYSAGWNISEILFPAPVVFFTKKIWGCGSTVQKMIGRD